MNHLTGAVHVKMHHLLAIERLAAPWPQRMRNEEEHMPKEGRRIKEEHQQGEKVRSLLSLVDLCVVNYYFGDV